MALSVTIEGKSKTVDEIEAAPISRKWSNRRDEGLIGLAWEDIRLGILTNDFGDRMKLSSQGKGLDVYDNEGIYTGHRTKLTVAEMDEYVKEVPKWMVVAGRIVGTAAIFWSGVSGALQALHEGRGGNGNNGFGENGGQIPSVASLGAGQAWLQAHVESMLGDDWKLEAPPRGMKGVIHPDVVTWRGQFFDQGLGVTNGAFEEAIREWKQWYQDGVYVELGGGFGELPDHQVLKDAAGRSYIVYSGDLVDTRARGTAAERQKTLFIAQVDQEGVGEPELLAKIGEDETAVLFGALKLERIKKNEVAPDKQFLLLKNGGGFGVQDGGGGMNVMSGPEGWVRWLMDNAGVSAAPEQPGPTAVEAQRVFTAEQVAASSDEQLLTASKSVLAGLKENELGFGWVPSEIIRADQGYNFALLVDPVNGEIKGVYNFSGGVVEKVVAGEKSEQGIRLGTVIVVSGKNFEEVTGREVFLNDKIGLNGEPIDKVRAQGNLVEWMMEKLAVTTKVKEMFPTDKYQAGGYFSGLDPKEKEKFVADATSEYIQKVVDGLVPPQTWVFVAEATEEDRVINWAVGPDPVAKGFHSGSPDTRIFSVNVGKRQWERGITYPTTPGSMVGTLEMVMGSLLSWDYGGGLQVGNDVSSVTVGIKALCGIEKPFIGVVSKAECLVKTRSK